MADVRVRMYNVGFGDCFLLEFPRDGGAPFRVLVDCGVHSAGFPREGWTIRETVETIIGDVGEGARIDVVVATHRHQDHVSGFSEPAWGTVTVDEVWLPWTEDPKDPQATRIRNRQSGLAVNLRAAFADSSFQSRWTSQDIKTSLRELVANSLTNETAMRTLHHGFAGKPSRRFLSSPESATIHPPNCPALKVHVLAPARDEATIRDMDPPPGQSYLRFGAVPPPGGPIGPAAATVSERNRPFAKSFVVGEQDYLSPLHRDVKKQAADMMRDTDIATAVSLDKAVNGTSLMIMFEFGSAYLLFPGDAQWGSWINAMEQPTSRDLLARTTFYKVGHHGSHNATPVDFLEKVLEPGHRLWGAAASVRPIAFWPEIPRQPLMDRLIARSDRVLRSDQPGRNRSGVRVRPGDVGVDFHVPC